jgi:hypothetical protein
MLTRSLRKMERTLDTVLRSIGNPGIASGMVSRSPSPMPQTAGTQALLASSPTPPPTSQPDLPPSGSPKLHSLPDNALNPLGLLAEASLANRRAQAASREFTSSLQARPADAQARKLGVASANYFKPGGFFLLPICVRRAHPLLGPMTILPLRKLYIERQIQPEMLSFVGTEEVVALFKMLVSPALLLSLS